MKPREIAVGVRVRSSLGTLGTITEVLGSGRGRFFVVMYAVNSRGRRDLTVEPKE